MRLPGRYSAAPRPHIPVMRVWATVPAQNLESIDVTGTHTQTHNRGQKTRALDIPGALVVERPAERQWRWGEAVLCQVLLSSDDILPRGGMFDFHLVAVGLRWCFI